MKIDTYGRVYLDEQDVVDYFYRNPKMRLDKFVWGESSQFVSYFDSCKKFDIPVDDRIVQRSRNSSQTMEQFDLMHQDEWFVPNNYKDLDVDEYVYNLCQNTSERDRAKDELVEYQKRSLYPLLRYLVYLVDVMRENNVVWGVGRGSSVASFVLYLIGVHKVHSLKYNLDPHEFFK